MMRRHRPKYPKLYADVFIPATGEKYYELWNDFINNFKEPNLNTSISRSPIQPGTPPNEMWLNDFNEELPPYNTPEPIKIPPRPKAPPPQPFSQRFPNNHPIHLFPNPLKKDN
jgi:hypothetical protein